MDGGSRRSVGDADTEQYDEYVPGSSDTTGAAASPSDSSPGASSEPTFSRRPRRIADPHDPWIGRVVDNRYRVLEAIGRGGMGAVYRVEHQRMSKIAAMKVLHREYTEDEEVTARFRREAEAVSRIDHPNVAQVFDFGSARGQLYLIMEFVRGLDLGTILHRDGPLSFARAAPLFSQICSALAGAHALGVVHRDLKLENVLVMRTVRGRDFVKVLDFGLAKLSEREERAEVTDRGSIVGTPYYMSPEQIRGEDVDPRTDVYSLGALMYRVLTGKHAFTAKTPVGVLTRHLTAEFVLPSKRAPELGIPTEVDRIIARTMARNRDDRYPAIDEVQDDLERAYVEECEQSGSIPLPEFAQVATSTRPQRRRADRVTATLAIDSSDQIDYGIHTSLRMQRADFDAYENALRARRMLRIAMVPLLLLAAGVAVAYFVVVRPQTPNRVEREPNDEVEQATLIAAGTRVSGFLGKRISKTVSDRDYYRLAADQRGAVVTAAVTALPNIDIELSLLDATGTLLTRVSQGGVRQGEWIHDYRVRGPILILVTESIPEGSQLPTENVSDRYELTVVIEPPGPDRENEPNESPSDAIPLEVNRPISGHLDRRADVDTYRFSGAAGRYTLSIDGASGVPVEWQLLAGGLVPGEVSDGGSSPSRQRSAAVELSPGALLQLARGDRDRPEGQGLPGVDAPYTVRLTPAAAAP